MDLNQTGVDSILVSPTGSKLHDDLRRILRIELPARQSTFLWGPRKSGKTSYLRARFPDSLTFDLLDTDLVLELHKRPALFREQVLAAPVKTLRAPVIVDEVQKVPTLLDEVHA